MSISTRLAAEPWQALWLNKGMELVPVHGSAMIEVQGVRGFLLPGDVEFLWELARSLPRGGRHVEVGSALGLTSILFANSLLAQVNLDARIVCVDTWDRAVEDLPPRHLGDGSPYEAFLSNVREARVGHFVQSLRGHPERMAVNFEDRSVDSIWIDWDHRYESVVGILQTWLPKLRAGGRVAGHDAVPGDGVRQAVERIANNRGLRLEVLPPPKGHYVWELHGV